MATATAPRYYFPPTPPPSSPPPFAHAGFGDAHRRKLADLQTPRPQPDNKAALFQRIIPKIGYLSPIYNYLTTPAPTPPPSRPGTASFNSDDTLVEEEFFDEEYEEMVKTSTFQFSAAAGKRTFAIRQPPVEDFLSSEVTYLEIETPISLRGTTVSRVEPTIEPTLELDNQEEEKLHTTAKKKRAAKATTKYKIPSCYGHKDRHPDTPESCDVVPCDWVRPRNSHRFNNYTNADVQCGIPKCETCIADETYGPKSVWALSAPKGYTAEAHRLRSRVRYLCSRCEQPAPPPPGGGIGPIEMCTCVLRDHAGFPTDIWFQCSDCAESNWFDHDARFRNPEGRPMFRRARKRKNKYGIVVRPRKGRVLLNTKRCCCGKMVPKDARYGIWCTWCNCPVDGEAGVELGGAATRSGPAFVVKENEDESDEEDDVEDGMAIDTVDKDEKDEDDTLMGEAEDSGIEI